MRVGAYIRHAPGDVAPAALFAFAPFPAADASLADPAPPPMHDAAPEAGRRDVASHVSRPVAAHHAVTPLRRRSARYPHIPGDAPTPILSLIHI